MDWATLQVPVTDDYESQFREESMKRFLPVAQLIVGLAMVPQAFLFGALGTLPLLRDILTARFGSDVGGTQAPYTWAVLLASLSVDAAAILCLASAVLLIRNWSQRGVRLSIVGATCYWVYMAGHLTMISTQPGGLRGGLTLLDAIDYPIGIIAALVAFALYWYGRAGVTPTAGSRVQPGTS
jgi:hypothetical protein